MPINPIIIGQRKYEPMTSEGIIRLADGDFDGDLLGDLEGDNEGDKEADGLSEGD